MQRIFDFNYDWQFFPSGDEGILLKTYSKKGEDVVIPHTPRIEELNVLSPFTGVMYYRKLFRIPNELATKKLFIDFEGVMTKATVYLNGKKLAKHYGGYLPFSVDITKEIRMNENNLLVVEVDNRDDRNVPPGKPTSDVDFLYFGGIYRNVKLRVTDKVYVDKPCGTKGGGVMVCTERVIDGRATIAGYTVVVNEYYKERRVFVKHKLIDDNGALIAEVETKPVVIREGAKCQFNSKMMVNNPMFWDMEHPYLYTLQSEVYAADELVDVAETRIGIRTIDVNEKGFFLNGKLVRLNGANRHQQFPYIGIAGSDNADYRDMYLLKKAGFNIVRLSHYPQSEALMDACDELGLMVIVCTPGWQFCKPGKFKKRVLENNRQMVRRDRNHPSAVIWEASLNETGFWNPGATDGFFKKCVNVIREEFAPYKVIVCGDTIGRRHWQKIGYDIPFTGWNSKTKIRVLEGDKLGMTREYGDYEFGGHNSNTRIRIGDGEMAMRIQAHNFQWSHNMNIGSPCELGDLIWEGIDHNRGMGKNKPISTSGILNEWRLPKYSYYFFKSQSDDEDMVFLPTNWTEATNGKLTVFSNAEEVELLINGQKIARQCPNDGETEYFDKALADGSNSVDYWQKGGEYDTNNSSFDLAKFVYSTLDNGANCKNLSHPPFTFDNISFEKGNIEAKAYRNGKVVASHRVYTYGEAVKLNIVAEYAGKELLADGRDKLFVHTYVVDSNNMPVLDLDGEVVFSIEGGQIFGSEKARLEAGTASAIICANKDVDKVVLSATFGNMRESIDINVKKVEIEAL